MRLLFYVSGSDCHGTPVTIRAKQEGRTPREISDYFHGEFVSVFGALGFSYDLYIKTTSEQHKDFVRRFHAKLYEGAYVYEKTVKQAFCPACHKVLTDRLILGKCPACGAQTRGDQCESAGGSWKLMPSLIPAAPTAAASFPLWIPPNCSLR